MLLAKKISIAYLALFMASIAAGILIVRLARVNDPLIPAELSLYPWNFFHGADAAQGGASTIRVEDFQSKLSFDFMLAPGSAYPYATIGLTFGSVDGPVTVDWSRYSAIVLRLKCRPDNVLGFILHITEELVTRPSDITTYRPATKFFGCSDKWEDVRIGLDRLDTPQWWLRQYKLNLANQDYSLRQLRGFSIASSPQSPMSVSSAVVIEQVTLIGVNWVLIYASLSVGLLCWAMLFIWHFRHSSVRSMTKPANLEVTLNYEPVDIDAKKDRQRSAVIEYMAEHYTNPELSVDMAVGALGINRAKINDILRAESNLTFSAYLNQVRLTEAARLMAEKRMGVAEAAFAVGYGSVSYFNRVFKKQYGCTPSCYKTPVDDARSPT